MAVAGREEFGALTPDMQAVILCATGFALYKALKQDFSLTMAKLIPAPFFF